MVCQMIFLPLISAFYFALLYLHNILWPKSVDSHTYISGLRVDRKSSDYFFLSKILQSAKHYTSVVYSATYEYGHNTHLPLWSLLLFCSHSFLRITPIICSQPFIDCLPTIFRCKYNTILTSPFRMLQTVYVFHAKTSSIVLVRLAGLFLYSIGESFFCP